MDGIQKWAVRYFPLICFILEFVTISLIFMEHNSVCIKAREISNSTHIFLLFTYPWILPDFLFFILSFKSDTTSIRPYVDMCHIVASTLCATGSIILFCGITFCGNIAQTNFLLAALGGFISAIVHAVDSRCIMDIVFITKDNMGSIGIRGPTINKNGGINICCCRVCTCVNFGFITSKVGLLKIIEVGLASMCETLLINYGVPYAESIGQALTSFLTATACCFTTSLILLVCYCFSDKSFLLIRQTIFEILFNSMACFLYLSASSYMGFATVFWLHPQFLVRPGFWAYPAMTAVYYLGYAAALAHGLDAYLSLRHFRGHR